MILLDGPDPGRRLPTPVLRNVIISGYATFYQVSKCFVNIFFFFMECLCGDMKRLRGPNLAGGSDLAPGPQFGDPDVSKR